MRRSAKLRSATPIAQAVLASVILTILVAAGGIAFGATDEIHPGEAGPAAQLLRTDGSVTMPRMAGPALSAKDRARAAKGLVDLNGNRLSDGLEDRLAGLAANTPVDVIVTFSGPVTAAAAAAQAAVGAFSVKYEYNIIDGFAATMTAGQARALAAAPGVFRVEEDATVYAFLESARPDFGVEDLVAEFGLDPMTGGLTGSGVTICLIDTGIQGDHEAFNTHNSDGTIAESRIIGFKDFTGDMNGDIHTEPYDYNGHGTHTAGIAAGDGVAGPEYAGGDPLYGPKARGVAPGASLLIAKVLRGDGTGADSGVLAGIEWCVEQGADIISASLGIPGSSRCSDAVCLAMEEAAGDGILPVVAAGNSGDMPEDIGSPAASPSSLTVGAAADFSAPPSEYWSTQGIYLAPFSSLGPTAKGEIKPDIAAPGVTVLSAYSNNYLLCDPLFGCLPDPYAYGCGIGCYNVLSGTSMATPYVAGVAALMLQANPSLTPAQIKQIIAETAQDRLTAGKDVAYGDGLIDALAAVKRAMGYADGSYAVNEFPSYFFGTDSVPDGGQTDIPIAVTDPSLPLAVSITIDGDYSCVSRFLGICLGYAWSPDLEMKLFTSNEAGEEGVLVFSSGCPAIGDCGTVGQRETAYVAANAATTHYLLRVYGWDGAPNNGKGGYFKFEISNGVDRRGGGTPPPNAPPSASFTVSCDGLSCNFTDSSTDDGTITGWVWDFGDGNLSAAQNPGHSYAAPGTYTVSLTVTDNDGLSSDPASQPVTVSEPAPNTPPSASFTVSCTDLSCSFTDSSTDDGTITGWAWDFGDGNLSAAQNSGHSYAAPGTYTVSLTVTDDDGLSSDPMSQSITVSEPPASPSVSIGSVVYSTEGGKRADKHLVVTIALADQSGGPVAGATVRVDIYRDGAWASDGSAVTGTDGSVAFSLKNATSGCYATTIRDISARGLTWDGVKPDTGFCKT